MSLVAVSCTRCGASMKVDSAQKKAICPYCNAECVIEPNVVNVNTYSVKYLNDKEIKDADDDLALGDKYMRLDEYELAAKHYTKASEKDPTDYRAYLKLFALRKMRIISDIKYRDCFDVYYEEETQAIFNRLRLTVPDPSMLTELEELEADIKEIKAHRALVGKYLKAQDEHIDVLVDKTRKGEYVGRPSFFRVFIRILLGILVAASICVAAISLFALIVGILGAFGIVQMKSDTQIFLYAPIGLVVGGIAFFLFNALFIDAKWYGPKGVKTEVVDQSKLKIIQCEEAISKNYASIKSNPMLNGTYDIAQPIKNQDAIIKERVMKLNFKEKHGNKTASEVVQEIIERNNKRR